MGTKTDREKTTTTLTDPTKQLAQGRTFQFNLLRKCGIIPIDPPVTPTSSNYLSITTTAINNLELTRVLAWWCAIGNISTWYGVSGPLAKAK